MKQSVLILVFAAAWYLSGAASAMDRYYVVELTARSGEVSFETLTAEKYETLMKEVETERRMGLKARALAEKEWRTSETTARVPFPPVPDRTARMKGTFDSMEKAKAKATQFEEDLYAKKERDAEREREREKLLNRSKEQAGRMAEKERIRQRLEKDALRLYEQKLQELLTPAEAEPKEAAGGEKPAADAEPARAEPLQPE